jgi:hypothetical protein
MITYDGTNTFRTSIDVPEGTDAVNIAAVSTALERLQDNVRFLTGAASQSLPLDKAVPCLAAVGTSPVDAWKFLGGVAVFVMVQQTLTSTVFVIPIDVPVGTVIEALSVNCSGGYDGNTHSSLPANKPILRLLEIDSAGAITEIDAQTDTSASVGAYDASHSIDLVLGSPYTTLGLRRYLLSFQGESGANSVAQSLSVTHASMAKSGP